MALSNILEDLYNSLSCCTHRSDQDTHILIKEEGPGVDPKTRLRKVILKENRGEWFSFNPDKGRGKSGLMSPLLSTEKRHGHHCACDCVVMVLDNNTLKILYFDLKSGNPSGYTPQFKSTRQFVRYSLGLLNDFQDHQIKIDKIEERFIVLYSGNLNKTPTVPKKTRPQSSKPNTPYKRSIQDQATLYLKEFLT